MKINNATLLNINNIMNKFGGASISLAYAIKRNRDEIIRLLKPFEECREELIAKYGDVDEDGKITFTEENQKLFIDEVNKILTETVDIDFYKISKEKFNSGLPNFEDYPDLKLEDVDILQVLLVENE